MEMKCIAINWALGLIINTMTHFMCVYDEYLIACFKAVIIDL